jgi:hypothetical protein
MVKSTPQLVGDRTHRGVLGTLKRLSGRLKALPRLGRGKGALTRQASEEHPLQHAHQAGRTLRFFLMDSCKVVLLWGKRSAVLKAPGRRFVVHVKARALRARGLQVKVTRGLLVIEGGRHRSVSVRPAQPPFPGAATRTGAAEMVGGSPARKKRERKKERGFFRRCLSPPSGELLSYSPWFPILY